MIVHGLRDGGVRAWTRLSQLNRSTTLPVASTRPATSERADTMRALAVTYALRELESGF